MSTRTITFFIVFSVLSDSWAQNLSIFANPSSAKIILDGIETRSNSSAFSNIKKTTIVVASDSGYISDHMTVEETLKKTNLRFWQAGTVINLERCLRFDGRLDGHIVQGHVDSIAACIEKKPQQGSWEFTFSFDSKFASLLIEKGSVSVNGISLTVFNVTDSTFTVAIIPYTFEHTNIQYINAGDKVNIEFDMIGKYVNRIKETVSR